MLDGILTQVGCNQITSTVQEPTTEMLMHLQEINSKFRVQV